MATIKELEKRIKKLEIKVSKHDKVIDEAIKSCIRIVDFVLERNRAYYHQRRRKVHSQKEMEEEESRLKPRGASDLC